MTSIATIFKTFIITLLWCSFPSKAEAQTWWSSDYLNRQSIELTTGANTPDKGYDGYTVRLRNIDTATLITTGDLRTDCNDLRIVYWDGTTNTELPRHVLGCNSANTDIRFKMITNQSAGSITHDYFFYYGNSAVGTPTALGTENVYLWYDDGNVNRLSSYDYGRFDAWAGTGYYSGTSYRVAGYYYYNTGDNNSFGIRRPVDERDVYIEVETYHHRCYPNNIVAGPFVRGIVTGSGASESSNHYYAGLSSHQNGKDCSATGYYSDGNIVKGDTVTTAVDGSNPPALTSKQWRRTAIASWQINPTHLSYYLEDNANDWDALGYPSSGNLHVSGTDLAITKGGGAAGYAAAPGSRVLATYAYKALY